MDSNAEFRAETVGSDEPNQSIYERSITLRFLIWLGRALNPFSSKKNDQSGDTHWLDEIDSAPEDDESLGEEAEDEDGEEDPNLVWPKKRLNVVEQLWGDGYITPGGEGYLKEYLPLLALTEKHSLLLLGANLAAPWLMKPGFGLPVTNKTPSWPKSAQKNVCFLPCSDGRR